MNTHRLLSMCLLMLLMLPTNVHSSTLAITCYIGQSASVTCNFNTNVTATKQDFGMARYDSPNDGNGNDVLVCKWNETQYKYDCFVEDGYMFNGVITDSLTVQIPIVSDKVAGFYMCFYVPPEGHAYPCELKVESMTTEKALHGTQTTLPPNEDNTSNTTLKAAICVIGVVSIVCVMFGVYWKCLKKKKRLTEEDECKVPLIHLKKKEIQEHLEGLELPKKNLEASLKKSKKPLDLMAILERETKQGLDNITKSEEDNTTPSVVDDIKQSDAPLQMYQLYCPLPDLTDPADFLVVDVDGTNLQISSVRLREPRLPIITSKSCTMKTGSGNQMLAIIADSIKDFVRDSKLDEQSTHHAAIIFPFPCHQKTSLKKARLAKCTKESCCEDIVNKDIQELLQNAIKRKTPFKVEIVAIVNDVVSTLVSVAHKAPESKIGLNVGTGVNACFVEQWRRVGTSCTDDTQPEGMVYNIELGALGDNGCLDKFRTDFDRELDEFSSNIGSQIFEKMVSWTHIGDIVKLTLTNLRERELLLPEEEIGCKLFQQGSITSDRVAIIDSDTNSDKKSDQNSHTESHTESPYQKTRDILTELEVTQYTDEDLQTIRYVCSLVCERATYLTAAALATLINRLDQPGVMIVVDGELNKKLPRFGELLYNITNGLVKPHLTDKFQLVSSAGRRNIGAALIAKCVRAEQRPPKNLHRKRQSPF